MGRRGGRLDARAREQKLAAWSEVARRVAHEIKNPLTPIRLSAERIAALAEGGPGFPRRSSAARRSSSKR